MAVLIRRWHAQDDPVALTEMLHRAYRQLADMGFRYYATHQPPEITLERIGQGECYVAEIERRVVGTVTFNPSETTRGTPWLDRPEVVSFQQFAVEPNCQGQGIGALLMDTVERRAAEVGAEEIACDTAEGATNLIAMYERRGYRFIEYADWSVTNYRSVVLSKTVMAPIT
jgi:GNAT superfamily N-acetyltransferase